MIRQLFTGIGVGAVVALLVHELFQHGLDLSAWSVRDPRIGRVILTGAVIGGVTQLVGARTGRR